MPKLLFGVALLLALVAHAQQPAPELRYDPPPKFYHSAIHPPEDFTASEFNAGLQIYPFRPFNGNIEQLFQASLLREWIDPRFQERNVAGPPAFGRLAIQGAQTALTAQFVESTGRQHMRMVVVAGNMAAIVDASASSLQTWQRAVAPLNQFSASLRVEAGTPVPSVAEGPGPAGAKVAGLYTGSKLKYLVDLNRPVGYGRYVAAFHYYLFSASGRVYRAYDNLPVPGGDPDRFDFDAAERADPRNSGRYTVKGNQLIIRIGEQPPETITVAAPQDNRVTIDSVLYIRK
jgi:hypothetical protein